MKTESNIEALYLLITSSTNKHETFINNLKLWTSFYNDRYIILKKNILNPKLFTIIDFLLEQEKGEIFDYFHSEILDLLYKEQAQLTHNLMNKEQKNSSDIESLITNLTNHDNLCASIQNLTLNDPFGDIKKYKSILLAQDTIDALTSNIYHSFFQLEPEFIEKSINLISKTILAIINTDLENTPTNKYIRKEYLIKIIPIKIFIGKDIYNDEIITAIKKYQIKDKNLLVNLFEQVPLETILTIFDENINNIIDFLIHVDYLEPDKKQGIIIKFLNKMINEEDYTQELLDFIMNSSPSELIAQNIYDCLYNTIINSALTSPIIRLNSDQIKFLLNSSYRQSEINAPYLELKHMDSIQKFVSECKYLIRNTSYISTKENFDIEGIKAILKTLANNKAEEDIQIKETDSLKIKADKASKNYNQGININVEVAIELLRNYLENKIELNEYNAKAILRSIASAFLNNLNTTNNGIYYHKSQINGGLFNQKEQTISLNTDLVNVLLNKEKPIHERLRIIVTMFHELTHAFFEHQRRNNVFDASSYELEKQMIVTRYDSEFYKENYQAIKEEIEARVSGIDCLMKFIETYMPEILDQIQDEMIEQLEEEKKTQNTPLNYVMFIFKELVERFNLVFDTLIKYQPELLTKYKVLNIEYYPNGTPKTLEDLLITKTEENSEIVESIIKERYPYTLYQQTNHYYHK